MEQDQYYYNLFMAQEAKRRADKRAAKTDQGLNGQQDQSTRNSLVFWITLLTAAAAMLAVATIR